MISTAQVYNLIEWLAEHHRGIAHGKHVDGQHAFQIIGQDAGADGSGFKYPRVIIPNLARGNYSFSTGIIDRRTIVFQIVELVEEGDYQEGIVAIFRCGTIGTEFIKKLRELADTENSGWEQVLQVLEFDNIRYVELMPNDLGNNCYGVEFTLEFKAAFNSLVDDSKWSS
jgi:tRNA isopentenyl-2-thiomethyl-A-37 hydroxylase MiaE